MYLHLTIKSSTSDDQVKLKLNPEDNVKKTKNSLLSYWGLERGDDFILLDIDGKKIPEDKNWLETTVESGETLFFRRASDRKVLPENLWSKRIDGEKNLLEEACITFESTTDGSNTKLEVELSDAPGPVSMGESIGISYKHNLNLILTREYPYRPPEIEWRSEIFHPNIAPLEKGGYVKMDYLSNWDLTKDLPTLMNLLKELLMDPQMSNICDVKSCKQSAKIYEKKGFPELKDRF